MNGFKQVAVVEGSILKTAVVILTYMSTFIMAHITTAGVGRLMGATLPSLVVALVLFFANWYLALAGSAAIFKERGWIEGEP